MEFGKIMTLVGALASATVITLLAEDVIAPFVRPLLGLEDKNQENKSAENKSQDSANAYRPPPPEANRPPPPPEYAGSRPHLTRIVDDFLTSGQLRPPPREWSLIEKKRWYQDFKREVQARIAEAPLEKQRLFQGRLVELESRVALWLNR